MGSSLSSSLVSGFETERDFPVYIMRSRIAVMEIIVPSG